MAGHRHIDHFACRYQNHQYLRRQVHLFKNIVDEGLERI